MKKVLMLYKKLDNNCNYDTINQVFVKNIISISGVLMYGKIFGGGCVFFKSVFFAKKFWVFFFFFFFWGGGGGRGGGFFVSMGMVFLVGDFV